MPPSPDARVGNEIRIQAETDTALPRTPSAPWPHAPARRPALGPCEGGSSAHRDCTDQRMAGSQ
eukprot:3680005-Alexandrium_andersonii.AAC.1